MYEKQVSHFSPLKKTVVLLGLFYPLIYLFSGCSRDVSKPLNIVPFKSLNYCFESSCMVKYKNFNDISEKRNGKNILMVEIPLPNNLKSDSCLYLPHVMEIFEIYLDGKKIYATGNIEEAKGVLFYGLEWHIIPIPETVKNKKLIMKVYSSNRFLIGPVKNTIALGTEEEIFNRMILDDMPRIMISSIFFFISILSFISWTIFKKEVVFYYSFLNILFSVFTFNLTDIHQLYYHNPALTILTWDISITAIIITFNIFFQSIFYKYRFYFYMNVILLVFSVIKFVVTGLNSFNEWTIVQNILFIFISLSVPFFCFKIFIEEKNYNALLLGLIVIFAPLVGILESFTNNFQHSMESSVPYVFFFSSIFLGTVTVKHYSDLINTNLNLLKKIQLEHEALEKLKYSNLQSRMSPHFFFNVLNILHSYILTKPRLAYKALQSISRYFRYLSEFDQDKMVPLKEELTFIENYIELMQLRFGKKIHYETDIKCDELNLRIPPLTVQPLVENAFKHGLRNNHDGFIKLQISEQNGNFEITVLNSGEGIKAEFSNSKTYANIAERLKYHYNNVEVFIIMNEKNISGTTQKITFSQRKQ